MSQSRAHPSPPLQREPSPPNADLTTFLESVDVVPPTHPQLIQTFLSIPSAQPDSAEMNRNFGAEGFHAAASARQTEFAFISSCFGCWVSRNEQVFYYLVSFSFSLMWFTPLINFGFNHRGCGSVSVEFRTLGRKDVHLFPKLVTLWSKYRSKLKPHKQRRRFRLRHLFIAEGLFSELWELFHFLRQ